MSTPKISVVLATIREDGRRLLFRALEQQEFKDFEVVVADATPNGEIPETSLRVKHVRVREPEHCQGCLTYNAGIAAAGGDAVLLTEDYVSPPPTWVGRHAEWQAREPIICAGVVLFHHIDRPPDEVTSADFGSVVPRHDQRLGNFRGIADIYCNNASVPREALLRIGGFDEVLDDEPYHGFWDVDMFLRLSLLPLPIVFDHELTMPRVAPKAPKTRQYTPMAEFAFYKARFDKIMAEKRTRAERSIIFQESHAYAGASA